LRGIWCFWAKEEDREEHRRAVRRQRHRRPPPRQLHENNTQTIEAWTRVNPQFAGLRPQEMKFLCSTGSAVSIITIPYPPALNHVQSPLSMMRSSCLAELSLRECRRARLQHRCSSSSAQAHQTTSIGTPPAKPTITALKIPDAPAIDPESPIQPDVQTEILFFLDANDFSFGTMDLPFAEIRASCRQAWSHLKAAKSLFKRARDDAMSWPEAVAEDSFSITHCLQSRSLIQRELGEVPCRGTAYLLICVLTSHREPLQYPEVCDQVSSDLGRTQAACRHTLQTQEEGITGDLGVRLGGGFIGHTLMI
jgi:hypothetical protein